MIRKRRWTIVGIVLGVYLLALGFLGGIVAERVRFDAKRRVVLHRYDGAVRQWQTYLIALEQKVAVKHQRTNGREQGEER